jgi:RimJ/RimL family protein N-acetyltransferase
MNIPDLAPKIRFPLLTKTTDALTFSFEAKRSSLGPYIEQRWGWDEQYQRRVHEAHFDAKPFFAIEYDRCLIGTVSLMRQPDYIRFGEFYLFPAEQKKGLGTSILKHCLDLADRHSTPVRLEYLKWNPVGTLYKRHGFDVIGETDTHWLMERAPLLRP